MPVSAAHRPATELSRRSRRPLSYRGTHRARRRAASLVAVAVCAALPVTGAVGIGADGTAPAGPPGRPVATQVATRAATGAATRPATQAAARHTAVRATRDRSPVTPRSPAVRASAPLPARRVVGYHTRTEQVDGRTFRGRATWYGPGFHGRTTANGERFNQMEMTAAHRTLPFGTRLRVCTRRRCVQVRINDRGPFGAGNVLDLSKAAARRLGTEYSGVAQVTATVVRTRTLRVPVFAPAAPKPRVPAAGVRAERRALPDLLTRPAGGAEQVVEAADLALVAEARGPSALASLGAGLGGLLLLAVMALPALRYRRRRGLTFVRRR